MSNMRKTNYLAILIFVSSVAVFTVPRGNVLAAGEDNFTVNTTNDTIDNDFSDGLCLDASGNCSLRAAIQQAVEHPGSDDTIAIPAGTYNLTLTGADSGSPSTRMDYANNAGVGDFDLYFSGSDITITGAGSGSTIINASGLSDRIFDVITGSVVTIVGATVKNGSTSTGGGIKCAGSSLTLADVIVSYNTASASAGALSSSDCSLTLSNTTFDHNTAVSDGGAAFISISSGNTIAITDSEFTDNTSNRLGGAIEFNQISGSQYATLNRVTFANNSSTGGATTGGGALEVYARVRITNGTFINNSSDTTGGAIEAPNNAADQLVIAHSTFVQNTAGTSGGGIYVGGSNANVQLKNSIIAANTAITSGPDCYATAGLTSLDYNFFGSVSACTFSAQTHDDTTTGTQAYMSSATLGDYGGNIQTVRVYGAETVDIIPSGSCTDAAGAALTTDARNFTRPQNTNCERGATEKNPISPVVTITAGTDTVECATGSWINAGATATDDVSTGLTASATTTANVNSLGAQTIIYTSTADQDGNTGTNTRTVTVRDTTAPAITVTGSTSVTHEAATAYTDAGATASDSCDSSVLVSTSGSIATTTLGAQTLTYTASDDSTNTATQKTRTITVVDTTPPVITLVGEANVTVAQGDTYTDAGATASDSLEGDLTSGIVTTNPVDTTTPGTYTVTYTVADASNNNAATVTRTVVVQQGKVTTNGKYLIVKLGDEVVDRLQINRKKTPARYRKLKSKNLYAGYTSLVLLTVNKTKAKLTVARLTSGYVLEQKVIKTFSVQDRRHLSLKVKKSSKRIILNVGKNGQMVKKIYRLKPNGTLKLVK